MPITTQDKQSLAQLHTEWHARYGGLKEDYFALLYLTRKFKLTVPELAPHVAFGNRDYGLDAYHLDRDARNLYLFQFKWSENHNLFKESLERLAKVGMERIFGSATADPAQNELLNYLRADLYEMKALVDRVFIQFVFKGDREAADNSEGLRDRRESLENRAHLVHSYFGRAIDLVVEFISDVPPPPRTPKLPEEYQLGFSDTACIRTTENNREMHVGFVPLLDLYRIYQGLGHRFFDRNIRFGLSSENPTNRKLREAFAEIVLTQRTQPDVFAFHHNGVTLACERLETDKQRTFVKVPRLLNGAQTITSLHRFLEDNKDHPGVTKPDGPLAAIRVLARIVVDDPAGEFVTGVTINNNRQNPVEPWNLRANDRIQCDLHDKFREEVQLFYARHENAFQSYSMGDLEEMGYEAVRDIRIRPLAQTFLAVQGEIARMSHLPEVFESQRQYDDTFRAAYLQADARKIVLAYKVHLVLRDAVRAIQERAAQRHQYAVAKARNLIWAILIQGLLNHPKLAELLDEYGSGLRRETAFRDQVKTIATSCVLPVLRELFVRDEYKSRLDEERYDFLGTKDFFQQCKEVAFEKFEWTKKSF